MVILVHRKFWIDEVRIGYVLEFCLVLLHSLTNFLECVITQCEVLIESIR